MVNAGMVVIIAMMSMTVAGQGARPQDVELQKVIRMETVDGDEVAAIRQYGELAAKYAESDRSIAAQSLLRQALLYQKRGDPRARSVFERVAHEYGDQSQPAAQARQALGGNTRRMTQERITAVIDDKGPNAVSPDGRWIVFASRDGFVIRRRGSTQDHIAVLAADAPVFSPDSKRIAFNDWGKRQLVVASLEGRWNPRVVKQIPDGVRYYDPGGWSSDGQSVLVEIVRGATVNDREWTKEIAWMSLATGETRGLFDLGRRRPQDQGERLRVSPDGQWIVYSALPADPGPNAPRPAQERARHLYLLAAQGGTPTEIVGGGHVNVRPVWMPDSRRVAFVSNRSGSFGLWSIRASGQRESPVLEMPSSGRIVPMAITRDGALYFARSESGVDLFVSDVRADGRVSAPARLPTGESGNFAPSLSPDGRFTAHIRRRKDRPSPTYSLVVHSMKDHAERVFDSHELAFGAPEWLADGMRVLVREYQNVPPVRGAGAIPPRFLVVNVVTGAATPATDSERPQEAVRIALPVGTPEEQRAWGLSPDGTRSAFVVAERGKNTGSLWLAAADGRGARQLATPASTRMVEWAADSRAIYFLEPRGDDSRVMRMPVDGGPPLYTGVTLPYDRQEGTTLVGSRLVFAQASAVHELWVVKNFALR